MKYNYRKRALSLLLAALLLLSGTSAAFAVGTGNTLIYVPDFTELSLYYNDGATMREVYNLQSNAFLQTLASIGAGFMMATEDVQSGADRINAAIDEFFYAIACDENGESKYPEVSPEKTEARPFFINGNTPVNKENLQAIMNAANTKFTANDLYVFFYDWRISPIKNAIALDAYIREVREAADSQTVTLLSGGYGGIIVNTYLALQPESAQKNVSRCVFLDGFLEGSSVPGDLMTGHFVKFAANADAFDDPFTIKKPDETESNVVLKQAIMDYVTQDPNGIAARGLLNIVNNKDYISLFSTSFLTLLTAVLSNEGVIGEVAAGIKRIAVNSENLIFDKGLRSYLRNMPGLWALVPADGFDDAIRFLFGDEAPSEALSEQIGIYRNIQSRTSETLRAANNAGVGIVIVAGYNRQILPLSATPAEESDALVPTRFAGAGVTTKDTPGNANRPAVCGAKRHKHLSSDGILDASTCYLPEQTWFIRNHRHMDYADGTAAFVGWLLTARRTPDIRANEAYPQYLLRSLIDKSISPYVDPDNQAYDFPYGDINDDGSVTAADARLALRLAVGLETPVDMMFFAADVDNDFVVTAEDARLILRYAVGLETEFPVEWI